MDIPTKAGATLYNRVENIFAVRSGGDEGWWSYGIYTFSDDGIRDRLINDPENWELMSEGFEKPIKEPKRIGAIVDTKYEFCTRWTEALDQDRPWIGAISGEKLSWEKVLEKRNVKIYRTGKE